MSVKCRNNHIGNKNRKTISVMITLSLTFIYHIQVLACVSLQIGGLMFTSLWGLQNSKFEQVKE